MATYFSPQVMDPNYYSFYQPPPSMDPNYYSIYQPTPAMHPNYYTHCQPYPVQYSYNQQFLQPHQPYQPQAQQQSTPEMLKQQELQQELVQQLQTRRNRQYSPQPRIERSQSPRSRQSQIPVSDNNIAIGSIIFLPHRKSGSINTIQPGCNHKLDYGGYNHPAIITHMWDERQNGELVTLCCMISANPRPNPMEKLSRLPISRLPKEQAPTTGSTFKPEDIMYLEREGSMYKQSYILTNYVYRIPSSELVLFNNSPWINRLSRKSYSTPMTHLALPEAIWVETSSLEAGTRDPSTTSPALPAGVTNPKQKQQRTDFKAKSSEDLDIQMQIQALKRLTRSRAHTT